MTTPKSEGVEQLTIGLLPGEREELTKAVDLVDKFVRGSFNIVAARFEGCSSKKLETFIAAAAVLTKFIKDEIKV